MIKIKAAEVSVHTLHDFTPEGCVSPGDSEKRTGRCILGYPDGTSMQKAIMEVQCGLHCLCLGLPAALTPQDMTPSQQSPPFLVVLGSPVKQTVGLHTSPCTKLDYI